MDGTKTNDLNLNQIPENSPHSLVLKNYKFYDPRSFSTTTWIKFILLFLFIIAIILAIVFLKNKIPIFLTWLQDYPIEGAFIFISVYVVAVVCFIPGSLLTLAAGFVFQIWLGIIIVLFGACIGLALSFLLGRYLFRDSVAKQVEKYPKFKAIDAAIAEEGWKIVALLRLVPIIPFGVINYALSLTKISFWQYFIA